MSIMRSFSLKTRIAAAVALVLLLVGLLVWAGSATPIATQTISADTAGIGGTGAWTTLPNLSYTEVDKGDLRYGTVTVNAPAGFEFDTTALVNVRVTAGGNSNQNINNTPVNGFVARKSLNTVTITQTTISFDIDYVSVGNAANTLSWEGVKVRPMAGTPLYSGNITITVPPGYFYTQGSTNMGTLTMTAGTASKVVTLLPGQTLVDGVVSNTQTPVTAGVAFNLSKLVVTDQFLNRVTTYNATGRTISYTSPAKICAANPAAQFFTNPVTFSAGESTTLLPTTFYAASTTTSITSIISGAGFTGVASSALTVNAGAATKLFVALPGQTLGQCGVVGPTPASNQSAGSAFPITITATDAYFNVANNPALPYENSKAITYAGPSGPTTTSSPVTFTAGVATNVSTTIADAQTNAYWQVSDGTITSANSSTFNVVGSAIGGFNAFDTGTAAAAGTGKIMTKIAGTAFSLDLVALNGASNISPGFSGSVTVAVVDASNSGGNCSNWTPIATLAAAQVFTGTPTSRITATGFNVANAYRNARVKITYTGVTPSIVACSNDNFAIRPSKFGPISVTDATVTTAGTGRTLQTASLLSSAVTHRAGRPFTITAAGQNSTGTGLSNYNGSPVAVLSSCVTAATDACTAALGTLSTGTWGVGVGDGVITTSTATYSEVGAVTLSLQDQTFADVDIGDTPAADRYFSSPVTVTAGRFTPDHFVVSGGSIRNRSALTACPASVFTYMGEAFTSTFTITANNAAGVKTSNYAGARAMLNPTLGGHLNFGAVNVAGVTTPMVARITGITRANPGRVTTALAHGLKTGATVYLSGIGGMTELEGKLVGVVVVDNFSFDLSGPNAATGLFTLFTSGGSVSPLAFTGGTGTWTAGALTTTSSLAWSRSQGPDGPYDAVSIGVLPVDTDGVTLSAGNLNADGDVPATLERTLVGTTQLRFGRLALRSSYGSQLLDLRIPIEGQQYNGTGFVINANDSCTTIANANMLLSDYTAGTSGITSTTLPQSNLPTTITLANGAGTILLRRPSPAPAQRGGALLSIDLGTTPVSGANLPYLLGNWAAPAAYSSNPSVRATFGNYRATPVIYTREVF